MCCGAMVAWCDCRAFHSGESVRVLMVFLFVM